MAKKQPNHKPTDGKQSASEQATTPAQPPAETRTTQGKTIATGEVHEHGNPEETPHSTEIVTLQQTEYAISIPKQTSIEAWLEIGRRIGEAMKGASWKIGDWCNFGVAEFGHKDYDAATQATGLSEQYLRACSSVASRVVPELRGGGSIERFRLVLAMPSENVLIPVEEQKGSTSRAETLKEKIERLKDWTMAELRNKQKRQALPPAPSVPQAVDGKPPESGNEQPQSDDEPKPDGETPPPPTAGDNAPPTMKAEGIYNMCGAILNGLEAITPDRLVILATFEEKEARLKPLAAYLKLILDQIGMIRNNKA
jgi:hypothetical protein